MAAKGNAAVSVNRTNVGLFCSAIETCSRQVSDSVTAARDKVRYLTDESNVGGNDSDSYREAIQASYDSLLNVQSKLEVTSKAIARIAESYGITATAKKRSIEECLVELQKHTSKIKAIS